MGLSNDLVSQFVKSTADKPKRETESTRYGTIVEFENEKYVRLDGSIEMTPVATTASYETGDRVAVLIKDHSATIIGNLTSPSASNKVVGELGTEVKQTGDKITAETARIDTLVADNVLIKNELYATQAYIEDLEAENVTITGKLDVAEAEIEDLKANKIDVTVLDAKYATIDSLEAIDAVIYNLDTTYAKIEDLEATYAKIKYLDATYAKINDLDAKYANIDFTNITEAAIQNFYAKSGIIEDLVVSDGHFTGTLVGVTIKGDLIEAGTIAADKLVVKGEDGLYYELNVNGETVEAKQTEYNSLSGSIITAQSITANKINVDDLVAFDATIGGFKIGSDKIYSGVKESADNSTAGIYLDSKGQVSFGDAANFLKYYEDTDGTWKLEIAANAIKFSTSDTDLEDAINNAKKQYLHMKYSDDGKTFTGNLLSTDIMDWESGYYTAQKIETDDAICSSIIPVKPGATYFTRAVENYSFRVAAYSGNAQSDFVRRFSVSFSDGIGTFQTNADETHVRISYTASDSVSNPTYEGFAEAFESGELSPELYGSEEGFGDIEGGYVGLLLDYNEDASTNFDDYEWKRNVGDKEIESAVNDVKETMLKQTTSVLNTAEQFTITSLERYVEKSEYERYQETTQSNFDVMSDRMTMEFESSTSKLKEVDGDVQSMTTIVEKHFEFTLDGLIIKAGENSMTLHIDNDLIRFMKNGQQFGWWDGIDFHTGNVVVEVNERAQFGNFAFVPRSDGSLEFLKVSDALTEKKLLSISATYTGGSVPVGTALNALTGITVTAYYSDNSSAIISDYGMTGSIVAGENIITVTYRDKSSRFSVIGEAEVVLDKISATYTGGTVPVGTTLSELTGITVTAHYSDGSSKNVTDYKLQLTAGEIKEGPNNVWVTYGGCTTTIRVTGVANAGDEPETDLVMRSGTTTSASIDTGLSSIKQFVLYRSSLSSVGLMDMSYNADLGTRYTYCSSYSQYTKAGNIATSSDYVSITGGKFEWTATSTEYKMADGIGYNWIAIGEL